jgi:hypothetical protein
MKKSMKRFISLVICIAMMTVMFAMPAYAVEKDLHDGYIHVEDGCCTEAIVLPLIIIEMAEEMVVCYCGQIAPVVFTDHKSVPESEHLSYGTVCVVYGEYYRNEYLCGGGHRFWDLNYLLKGYTHSRC